MRRSRRSLAILLILAAAAGIAQPVGLWQQAGRPARGQEAVILVGRAKSGTDIFPDRRSSGCDDGPVTACLDPWSGDLGADEPADECTSDDGAAPSPDIRQRPNDLRTLQSLHCLLVV